MEQDFLPKLRRRPAATEYRKGVDTPKDFKFRILVTPTGATVATVDSNLSPVVPDHRYFNGDVSNLLRTLEGIDRQQLFNISWGEETGGISLDSYPYLMYQLVRCHNIVDGEGNPLSASAMPATVNLSISEGETGGTLQPEWGLILPGGERNTDFTMLTDSFALADGTIYPVNSMDANYRDMGYFISPITEGMLERYLSVLFSYLDSFTVTYGNYVTEISDEEIDPMPALIFEKIDSDLALHLRVSQSLPGIDEDFLKRFDLSASASVLPEGVIRVRRVRRRNIQEDIATVCTFQTRHKKSV